MKKTKSKLTNITRILGAIIIIGIIAFPFVWPHIRFNKDYNFIKQNFQQTPGPNPFVFPLPTVSLTQPSQWSGTQLQTEQKGFYSINKDCTLEFLNDNFLPQSQPYTNGMLENDKIRIILGDSLVNATLIENKNAVSFLSQRPKSDQVQEFIKLNDPFEKFKRVLESNLTNITEAKNLSDKYLGLYLYSLKAFFIRRLETEAGYSFIQTPNFKGILFGNIQKTEVKAILFHTRYKRFVSLLFKKKGEIDKTYIESFITSLNISFLLSQPTFL